MKRTKWTALIAAALLASPAVLPTPLAQTAYATTKLSAPTNVILNPDRTVSWTAVTNDTNGYQINVYNSATNALLTSRTAPSNVTTFSVNDAIVNNGTYYVRVLALGDGSSTVNSDLSLKSNTLTVSYSITTATPTGLTLTNAGVASWKAGQNNGYILELYHYPSNTLVATQTLAKDATTFNISPLIPQPDYYYFKLIAKGDSTKSINDSAESYASSTVNVNYGSHLPAPTHVVLNDDRTASWNSVSGNNGYRVTVYRADTNRILGFAQAAKNATSLDVSSLIKSGGSYYVKVQAVGTTNNSSLDSAASPAVMFFLGDHLFNVPTKYLTTSTDTTSAVPQTTVQVDDNGVNTMLNDNTNLYQMVAYLPSPTSGGLQLNIPGDLLDTMAKRSTNADLRVMTGLGNFTLDLSQLQTLATANQTTLSDTSLQIGLAQTAATKPADLAAIPVQISVKLMKNQQAVADLTTAPNYLSFSIPIGKLSADSFDGYAGMRYDEKNNLTPVPTVFTNGSDGNVIATFNYQGTGTFAVTQQNKSFPDVPASLYAQQSIESLAAKQVITGFEDGTFHPSETVTRAQFAMMLVKALGLKNVSNSSTPVFSDVATDAWYADVVNTAYNAGLISGRGQGIFAPSDKITAQEMASMITRALKYAGQDTTVTDEQRTNASVNVPNADAVMSYAKDSVALCYSMEILYGTPLDTFAPTKQADRAMAADMLYRMLTSLNFIN